MKAETFKGWNFFFVFTFYSICGTFQQHFLTLSLSNSWCFLSTMLDVFFFFDSNTAEHHLLGVQVGSVRVLRSGQKYHLCSQVINCFGFSEWESWRIEHHQEWSQNPLLGMTGLCCKVGLGYLWFQYLIYQMTKSTAEGKWAGILTKF